MSWTWYKDLEGNVTYYNDEEYFYVYSENYVIGLLRSHSGFNYFLAIAPVSRKVFPTSTLVADIRELMPEHIHLENDNHCEEILDCVRKYMKVTLHDLV